jgi:hypothetical protein
MQQSHGVVEGRLRGCCARRLKMYGAKPFAGWMLVVLSQRGNRGRQDAERD